jgi:hypothetical protein
MRITFMETNQEAKGVLDFYYVFTHHSILSLYVPTLCQTMFPIYLSKEKRIVELGTSACAATRFDNVHI